MTISKSLSNFENSNSNFSKQVENSRNFNLLIKKRVYSEGIVARQWESLEKGVTDHGRRTDGRHVPGVKQHNREIVATKKTGVSLITRPPIKMTPERKLCTISSLIKVIFLP